MYKIYDISMEIHEGMQVYKDKEEKKPIFTNTSNFTTGRSYETRISLDAHCGTHVDAPLHMLQEGETIETISLESLAGFAKVFDLTHVKDGITRKDIENLGIQAGDWVLFKTQNSMSETFNFEFIYVKEDAAQFLIEKQVKGIGVDGLGIERAQPSYTTHRPLMKNKITIVEGLRLKEVPEGTYFMIIAPLKLRGIEAAPARALLLG